MGKLGLRVENIIYIEFEILHSNKNALNIGVKSRLRGD